MQVLLVVAGRKFTGAAAVAEISCRALRAAGIDARLLFGGGRNLTLRLEGCPWASPALSKERSPLDLVRNLRTIRRATAAADVVIPHLPHDHALSVAAGVHQRHLLVRAFRNPRHLGGDPFHRYLARRTHACLLANSSMNDAAPPRPRLVVPVAVDPCFAPGGDAQAWRRRLAVPDAAAVVGMVGKLAAGRGFDLLLEAAASIEPPPHVLAVGVGEAQPALQALARGLGIAGRVHWAGYHEDELPSLYAAMDVVVVAAAGSDHGHRAVSEAQACGRPVVVAELPGIGDLVADGRNGRVVPPFARAIAAAVAELLERPELARSLSDAGLRAADSRRPKAVGRSMADFLSILLANPRPPLR